MATKPTIVFAPGAWHTPDCFDLLRGLLKTKGWETEVISCPSVGAEPPTKTLADNIAAARDVIKPLVEQGKKVIVMGHSYAGVYAAEAVKGLGYRQQKEEGKLGGIVMFMYVAAFVAPAGMSVKDMLGGKFLSWTRFEGNYVYADTPEIIFYHDLEPAALEAAVKALKHEPAAIFTAPITYEPWHDMECMYFFCGDDKTIVPAGQELMIKRLGDDPLVYRCDCSHSPFLSVPEEMVKGLEFAAKAAEERAK